MPRHFRFLSVLVLSTLAAGAAAEEAKKPPIDFPGLKYRLVGPFTGGRTTRAAGLPGDPFTYYVTTASGGVWKSTDGGLKWKPIFDDMDISSIGSLAIAPSDPNVIYVGSGEANIRGNVAAGNGIYKSTDAGKTWAHVWKQDGQIGTMVVHPKNPDIAFAAVLGHAFGPNPERGVYRTVDGGKTWQQVLKKDADTGASDVCMDPNNPRILFAGLWQARRKPWDMVSGGPGSGFYASRDGGDTWKELGKDEGIPEGIKGKIGCAVATTNSQRVYALIESEKGGLFRFGRWRRVVLSCESTPRSASAGLVLLDSRHRSDQRRHRLVSPGAVAQDHRRGQDDSERARASWRSPRCVDRPQESRADDPRP